MNPDPGAMRRVPPGESSDDDEEDEKRWGISARGPSDYNKRNQMRNRGWMPYSIRIGGHQISYQYSPLVVPLTMLGTISDAKKYGDWDEEDLV